MRNNHRDPELLGRIKEKAKNELKCKYDNIFLKQESVSLVKFDSMPLKQYDHKLFWSELVRIDAPYVVSFRYYPRNNINLEETECGYYLKNIESALCQNNFYLSLGTSLGWVQVTANEQEGWMVRFFSDCRKNGITSVITLFEEVDRVIFFLDTKEEIIVFDEAASTIVKRYQDRRIEL